MINRDVVREWAEKLESGEYEQGRLTLRNPQDQYCCLGVLCELAVKHGVIPPPTQRTVDHFDEQENVVPVELNYQYGQHGDTAFLPEEVREWAFGDEPPEDQRNFNDDLIYDGYATSAVHLNDSLNLTFPQIAKAIRDTHGV